MDFLEINLIDREGKLFLNIPVISTVKIFPNRGIITDKIGNQYHTGKMNVDTLLTLKNKHKFISVTELVPTLINSSLIVSVYNEDDLSVVNVSGVKVHAKESVDSIIEELTYK